MNPAFQAEVLARHGASPAEAEELRSYNENVFDLGVLGTDTELPLPDEPFVAFWERVADEAREAGAFAALARHLPQLRFPLREGISETEDYRAATRRGVAPETLAGATGLAVGRPERIELDLYPSPAGRIPLLICRGRAEFAALLRALTQRNEPGIVPDSQGALMVSGYNNWSRIGELRRRWEALPADERTGTWADEFRRIQADRDLYQDRFILLSDGPYSAVPAAELGLGDAEWREMSLVLRRDHECAHYFTRRLFGSMRNNALDELIADWAGITAALGAYRADWFLRFMDTRLDLYRGKPPLSDGAFRVLRTLLGAAARNLERLPVPVSPGDAALTIAALASLRLEEIAAPDGDARVGRTIGDLRHRVRWRG